MMPHTPARREPGTVLAASHLGAVEAQARPEADRNVQFASTVRIVEELHARHPPRVGQLQDGGERRSSIHTTKPPESPHHLTGFTHIKQRNAVKPYGFFIAIKTFIDKLRR